MTDIGTFQAEPSGSEVPGSPSADGKGYVYYAVREDGNNWNFDNPDSYTSSYIPYVQSHIGIYHGEKASLYKGMTGLKVPELSEEEEAKGYEFKGWKLRGDDSGKIYTESEALAYQVRRHVVFEAVWERTIFDVTVTDDGNGTGSAYPESGPTGTRVTLTATPNSGYEFDKWEVVSGDVTLSDPKSATATFDIGTSDVKVKATFKAAPPKPKLIITAKDRTYVYNGEIQGPGDVVYEDPQDIAEAVTVSGLIDGDSLSSVTLDGQGKEIGEYPLIPSGATIGGTGASEKYDVTYVNGKMTITKQVPVFTVTYKLNGGKYNGSMDEKDSNNKSVKTGDEGDREYEEKSVNNK